MKDGNVIGRLLKALNAAGASGMVVLRPLLCALVLSSVLPTCGGCKPAIINNYEVTVTINAVDGFEDGRYELVLVLEEDQCHGFFAVTDGAATCLDENGELDFPKFCSFVSERGSCYLDSSSYDVSSKNDSGVSIESIEVSVYGSPASDRPKSIEFQLYREGIAFEAFKFDLSYQITHDKLVCDATSAHAAATWTLEAPPP